ncbi:hypothetical protein ACHAWO_010335 [Cyclotella atomus]|uniref:DUF6824 domain-containing protein n=1 Tax=Cyclotella atomus TaxID=382360 RepID=A0ABD3PQG9_9STRA
MDHFNNYMNNDYAHDGGQFSDLAGFGNNQMCHPFNDQPSEPMPSLPNMNSFNDMNSNNDLFCGFINETQMTNAAPMMKTYAPVPVDEDVANSSFDKSKLIQPSSTGIKFYSRNDVLCGRGGGTNVHPGNRRFRDLINANRRAYLKARKNDKPAISRSIVRTIREMNGRFLKKDEKLGLWFEIGDDGAREKTSQALRQRAPEMKKILFEDEQRQRNEQLSRQQQQQQAALMQRSFMNNSSMNNGFSNNNNFSRSMPSMEDNFNNMNSMSSNMNSMSSNMNNSDLPTLNPGNNSIYEQYAMLQQKKYFEREQDVFLKKLAMNGFDPTNFQNQQRDIESLTSQTLLSQGIKPITPRGA